MRLCVSVGVLKHEGCARSTVPNIVEFARQILIQITLYTIDESTPVLKGTILELVVEENYINSKR